MTTSTIQPLSGFFQQGYVTNDLEQALRFYRDQLGVKDFFTFDTAPYTNSLPSMVALAWIGSVMVELIQPIAGPAPHFADHFPQGDFGIRFHHFGYLTTDADTWRRMVNHCQSIGFGLSAITDDSDFINFAYLDARPALGHFIEAVLAFPQGEAFLRQVPQN